MGGLTRKPCARILWGMNVTLSLSEKVLERARKLAARRGISLNQMIRDYLSEVTGEPSSEDLVLRIEALWAGVPRGFAGVAFQPRGTA